MVKIKIPPLKNEIYTKVLVEIGGENPSIKELAKRVKKEISSVSEYLNELEELECVKRRMNKNPFYNTKEVSIEWQGLTKQYLIYLIKEQNIVISNSDIEFYSKNKYLQKLIRIDIIGHQKSAHDFRKIGTVYQLFEKITMQMIYGDETFSNKVFKRLRKRKTSFYWFRKFVKNIKEQKVADKRKTFKKFLKQIIKEVETERTSKKK